MSSETNLDVTAPQWMLDALQHVPNDRAIGLLLRHADREALLKDFAQSYIQPITEIGRQRSLHLGKVLGNDLVCCHSSPLTRCMQTMQYVQQGADVEVPIVSSPLLGDPGVFVVDADLAGQTWSTVPVEQINDNLCSNIVEPLKGLARGRQATSVAIQKILSEVHSTPGVHLYCSHDSIVGPVCSHLMSEVLSVSEWPRFLEGVLLWLEGSEVRFHFRNTVGSFPDLS